MKALRVAQLLCLIAFLINIPQPANDEKKKSFYFSSYDINRMVEESERVFFGEVTQLTYVPREELHMWVSTDVTVELLENIKGEPNTGPDHVTFMIKGGIRYSPEHKTDLVSEVMGAPTFKKGEKVLLFLKPHPHLGKKHPRTGRRFQLPYDGLIVGMDGKIELADNWAHIPYSHWETRTVEGKLRTIMNVGRAALPIPLVVKMARASLIDPIALKPIDDQLRIFAKNAPVGVDFPGGRVPSPSKAELERIEAQIDTILKKAKPNAKQGEKQ